MSGEIMWGGDVMGLMRHITSHGWRKRISIMILNLNKTLTIIADNFFWVSMSGFRVAMSFVSLKGLWITRSLGSLGLWDRESLGTYIVQCLCFARSRVSPFLMSWCCFSTLMLITQNTTFTVTSTKGFFNKTILHAFAFLHKLGTSASGTSKVTIKDIYHCYF